MAYEYQYLNKQVFENSVCYTLILEDFENGDIVNTVRIEKSFKQNENLIDEQFLRLEAKKEIKNLLLLEQISDPIEEVSPDEATNDG